jgi:hypothetical protein
MIAFGCSIFRPDVYERCAGPGIRHAAEADSVVMAHASLGSIARGYNLLLERAAPLAGLEALVIVHEDAELLDRDFCPRLRAVLADPQVAVVGCVGASGARDIAWWDGTVTWNSAPYRYQELGGGELTLRTGEGGGLPLGERGGLAPGEVDTIYGVVIGLSPWAVSELRFDESIGTLHGYDFDICRRAWAAGKVVRTADLRVAHHHPLDLVSQIEVWVGAHIRAAEAWDAGAPAPDAPDSEWKPRARAAEAEAAAARLLAASKLLQADAAAQQGERELDRVRNSPSWRLTEPLRRGNAVLRSARERLDHRRAQPPSPPAVLAHRRD